MSSARLRMTGAFALVALAATPVYSKPHFLARYHEFGADSPWRSQVVDLDGDGKFDVVGIAGGNDNRILVWLGDGASDFESRASLPLPSSPHDFKVAPVNTDAHLDLVVTHGLSSLSVFYGNGDGTFGPRIDLAVGSAPVAVEVGDLDEDGRNDLVVAVQGTDELWILFGLFDEFFFPVVRVPTELDPAACRLADLNDDDHLDVVVLNQTSNTISTRLGDGQGGFSSPTTHGGYASMTDLVVADLDQDTVLDVATLNNTHATIAVFRGNGDGSLQAPTTLIAGTDPRRLVVTDLNADTTPDLVVVKTSRSSITHLLGTGGGTFAPPVEIVSSFFPSDGSFGDMDGDSKPDLVVTSPSGISIHHSNGDGTFGFAAPSLPTVSGFKHVLLRDLDVDGKLDLVVASLASPSLIIKWGLGNGWFEPGPTLATGPEPRGIAVGDVNGDGWLDLATADAGASAVSLFFRSGHRTYAAAGSVPTAAGLHNVGLAHFNGDNVLDLVALTTRHVHVKVGLGGGAFGAAASYLVYPNFYIDDLDLADVNLDGKLDVLVTQPGCCPSNLWQLLGNGDGTLQSVAEVQPEVGGTVKSLGVGFLDANASPDLVVGPFTFNNPAGALVQVRAGNGDGTYGSLPNSDPSHNATWVEIADIDGDDKQDAIVANEYVPTGVSDKGSISVRLGDGDGTFRGRIDYRIDARATRFAVGDLNGDQAIDLVVADTNSDKVLILLNQRDGVTDAGGETVPAGAISARLAVYRNSGTLRIEYDTGARGVGPAALDIFDVRGHRIRSLHKGPIAPGPQYLSWDGNDDAGARVARGVYWVNLRTPSANLQRRVVHLRR